MRQRSRARLESLRLAIYAMAPMPTHELRKAIETFGCEFSLMFGQTEMNPLAVYFRPEHQLSHPGAVGTPSANVQVAIMDPSGALLPNGRSGEIVYRSPQVMSGYLKDRVRDRRVAFAGGWFHSGDAGRLRRGRRTYGSRDRFKSVIKSGGEDIASIEIEKAIYAAGPIVQEVAVIGLPHDRWDEAVTAIVTPEAGTGDGRRRRCSPRCATTSAPSNAPSACIFVEDDAQDGDQARSRRPSCARISPTLIAAAAQALSNAGTPRPLRRSLYWTVRVGLRYWDPR